LGRTTKISFIRHGDVHNPDNIIYGRLPRFPLSIKGEGDAIRAALYLKNAPLKAVYSSPLLRTRQTAKYILQHHPSIKLHQSRHIIEVNTSYEGQSESILNSVGMDVYHNKDPKWEQPTDIHDRVHKFLRIIRKRFTGSHTAAVTHGDIVLFTMFWAYGIDLTPANKLNLEKNNRFSEYPATGSVTTLVYTSESETEIPEIEYVNLQRS